MFADTASIEIRAGKGGDGRSSFRHEKYRALGGPDGGDGGRGGDVIFLVDHNAHTLSNYRTSQRISAEDGISGGENRRRGKSGEDIVIKVPPGTQIWHDEELLADLAETGQQMVLAKGGRGGFGNAHFVSSTRQAPRTSELGEPGERLKVRLELKLVADVGLVGLPNAGKSTLLSVITNAKPEIADYAFTTLVPNLGVVDHRDQSFLMADIPGLIEGASEGKGLGDEFLRHVERTAVLLHLVDVSSADVAGDYATIVAELGRYAIDLSDRPRVVALTKIETVESAIVKAAEKIVRQAGAKDVFAISSQAHKGLTPMLDELLKRVATARAEREAVVAEEAMPVITTADLPDLWQVDTEDDGIYRVTGARIEGFALRTNYDQDEALERLRDIMRKQGIARELRRQGIQDGDTVHIGESELAWYN